MNRLTRYVFWQLMVGMLLVSTALTAVVWLTQSLNFIEMIVERGLTTGMFVYFTALLIPNFLTLVLPIALFAVILFTYNKMMTDHELVVMRAAGLGPFALARPALWLSFFVVLVSLGLNLYLVPESYRQFRDLRYDIRNKYSHVLLQEGAFNEATKGVTVYIRERAPSGELLGILAHDTRDPAKRVTLMANKGAMVKSGEGSRIVMFDGNRQEIDTATKKFSILYFDQYVFNIGAFSKKDVRRGYEPRARSMQELLSPELEQSVGEAYYGKYLVEAHKRITNPIHTLGFAMIALAGLLSGGFNRRTQSRRVVFSVALIILLQLSILGLENMAAKNIALIPTLYGLAAVPIIGAIAVLGWAAGWTRKSRPAGPQAV